MLRRSILAPALSLALLAHLSAPARAQEATRGTPQSQAFPARCAVQGTRVNLPEVRVAPEGAPSFSLEVSEAATVSARPPGGGDLHLLEVQSALRFTGVSAGSATPYSLSRPVRTGAGMALLSGATRVQRVRARGAGLLLDARPIEELHLLDLEVPCDALQLLPPASGTEHAVPSGQRAWIPRRKQILFRSGPGTGGQLRARIDRREAVVLWELQRVRGWIRLRWGSADGAEIEGWVAQGELEPRPSIGYGRIGMRGQGRCGRAVASPDPGVYRGPAQIHAGAEIYAAPGVGRWAIASSEATFQVLHRAGEEWAQIQVAPGLRERGQCGWLAHAWARLSDLILPPDAEERRGSAPEAPR